MRARHAWSMRSRLVLLLVGASALVLTAAIALAYRDARRELGELFDAQLAESGRVILTQAGHELAEAAEHGAPRVAAPPHGDEHRYGQRLHVQVWNREGRLVYRSSDDLPDEPLVAGLREGFADRALHGARWRVLALADAGSGMRIQVCQRDEGRRRLAATIARHMLLPLVVALPVLAGLIWLAATRGLRPLNELARALEARAPHELEPLRTGPVPRELAPVVGALDGLLASLRERLELERRFTADAAHELRTPLAALKTQAQVALGARSAGEREHALAQVSRGVDRATHLVAQLLTLARLDHERPGSFAAPVDLADVAREAVAQAAPAEAAPVVDATAPAPVAGDRALLLTLCRNLVENALRHGGAGPVRVSVARDGGGVALHVVDAGPGIPAAERERVFDRFTRGTGAEAPGSGLGLSIVKRIADLHGATVELGDGPGGRGLAVTVRFPAPTSADRPAAC